ncbi:MAG: DUF4352 domain-containing protein [Anaerolineales bacterium]|nr:DUF4352 domain-containing protein [Anaerolineales bacterium]
MTFLAGLFGKRKRIKITSTKTPVGIWLCNQAGAMAKLTLTEDGQFRWEVNLRDLRADYKLEYTEAGDLLIRSDSGVDQRDYRVTSLTFDTMDFETLSPPLLKFHWTRMGGLPESRKKRLGPLVWGLLAVVFMAVAMSLAYVFSNDDPLSLGFGEPTRTPVPVITELNGLAELHVKQANLDAWERLNQGNSEAEQPPDGVVEVLLEVSLQNTSSSILELSLEEFFLIDQDGNRYDYQDPLPYGQCGFFPDVFAADRISPGNDVSGNLCFRVPKDANNLQLGYQELSAKLPKSSGFSASIVSAYSFTYEELKQAGFWREPPEAESQIVLVNLLLANDGALEVSVKPEGFSIMDDQNESYLMDCEGFTAPSSQKDYLLSSKAGYSGIHIPPGENQQGMICFQIPSGRQVINLAYTSENPFAPVLLMSLPEFKKNLETVPVNTPAQTSDGIQITLDGVAWEGWPIIREQIMEEKGYYPDDPDEAYIVVDVSIQGSSTEPVEIFDGDFNLLTEDGDTIPYSLFGYCEDIPDPLISGFGLHESIYIHGSEVTGQLCFHPDTTGGIRYLVYSGQAFPPVVFELSEDGEDPAPLAAGIAMQVSNGLSIDLISLNWDFQDTVPGGSIENEASDAVAILELLISNQGNENRTLFLPELFLTDGQGNSAVNTTCDAYLGKYRSLNSDSYIEETRIELEPGQTRRGILCFPYEQGQSDYRLVYDGDPLVRRMSLQLPAPGSEPVVETEEASMESTNGLSIEILEINDNAWPVLQELNPDIEEPEGLEQLIVLNLEVQAAEAPVQLTPSNLLLAKDDSAWIFASELFLSAPLFLDGEMLTVEPGSVVRGQIAFEFTPVLWQGTDCTGSVCFDGVTLEEQFYLLYAAGDTDSVMLQLPDIRGTFLEPSTASDSPRLAIKLHEVNPDAQADLEEEGWRGSAPEEGQKMLYLDLTMCMNTAGVMFYLDSADVYLSDQEGGVIEQTCTGCIRDPLFSDQEALLEFHSGMCYPGALVFSYPSHSEGLRLAVQAGYSSNDVYYFELPRDK